MKKKALLALLLVAVLVLSGCSLQSVNTEKDNARVVIRVGEKEITKGALDNAVQYAISQNQYMNQMYQSMGLGDYYSAPTDYESVLADTVQGYINQLVRIDKAEEMGMSDMTAEETAEIEAAAKASWDEDIETIKSYYLTATDGLNEEAIQAEAEKYAADMGLKMENYIESARQSKMLEKLKTDAVRDITVTEEELQAYADEKVENAKTTYTSSLSSFGYNYNKNAVVYYMPAGYRMVKKVLVKFTEEDASALKELNTALTTANSAYTTASANLTAAADTEGADIEALTAAEADAKTAKEAAQAAYDERFAAACAAIKEKADTVYGLLTAGGDTDAVIKEYNEDADMPERGYAVCEGYIYFKSEITAAAMALENIGDVSEPVASGDGYHIIVYTEDVAEGPVALDTVRETVTDAVLANKQDEEYDKLVAIWTEDANVFTRLDIMK